MWNPFFQPFFCVQFSSVPGLPLQFSRLLSGRHKKDKFLVFFIENKKKSESKKNAFLLLPNTFHHHQHFSPLTASAPFISYKMKRGTNLKVFFSCCQSPLIEKEDKKGVESQKIKTHYMFNEGKAVIWQQRMKLLAVWNLRSHRHSFFHIQEILWDL